MEYRADYVKGCVLELAKRIKEHEHCMKALREKNLAMMGIVRKGDILAKRIATQLRYDVPIGRAECKLYDADLKEKFQNAQVMQFTVPESLTGKTVIIVDDVLYTGRTAAEVTRLVNTIYRPLATFVAVLVTRWNKAEAMSCVRANFYGNKMPCKGDEVIDVVLARKNLKYDRVVKRKRGAAPQGEDEEGQP